MWPPPPVWYLTKEDGKTKVSTPLYPQIKIKGLQIKIKGLQIKIKGLQIKITGYQIKIRGHQIKIKGLQIKIRRLQIKIKGIQIKTHLRNYMLIFIFTMLFVIHRISECFPMHSSLNDKMSPYISV